LQSEQAAQGRLIRSWKSIHNGLGNIKYRFIQLTSSHSLLHSLDLSVQTIEIYKHSNSQILLIIIVSAYLLRLIGKILDQITPIA
jgi:hypothetical protein